MTRLVLTDLTAHARVWLGVIAVAVATGLVGAMAAGLIETGVAHGGRIQEGLSSTSAAVIMFTAITAVIVLSATANLTVSLHRRGYALWQLVGVRPALVALVVLVQLAIAGALGALAGVVVAVPVFPPLFGWLFREWPEMQGIDLHLGLGSVLAVVTTTVLVVLLGGLRGARRASRTPPVAALRDAEPPSIRMGWFRIVLAVLLLGGAAALAANLDGSAATLSAFAGRAVLLTPLLAAALAAAGPVVFPLALRAWTSLLPARLSVSWFLARHTARHRLSRSTATISPLMVAVALSGGLYTMAATLDAALAEREGSTTGTGLAPEGVVLLLGGPLLLSAVAAAATVFMSEHTRERELALVQAVGATHGTVVLSAIWEAVIYAVTALLLGAAATIGGGLIIAGALSLPVPTVSFGTLGLVTAGGLVLVLAATVVPTAAALRHDVSPALAAE